MLNSGEVVDLQKSERVVDQPLDVKGSFQRISRKNIDQVLWQGRRT